jgi:MFS family permease
MVLTRAFALAYVGTLLVSLPAVLPHVLLVATAGDLGLPRNDALALLALLGLGTIAGRFALAALADSLGRKKVFLTCCIGMSGSLLIWAMAAGELELQAFALCFGALQGGFVALLPAFVADSFGARSVGGLLGVLYTGRGIALLMAPPLLAFGVTALSGHALPLAVIAVLGLVGSLLLASVRPQEGGR